MLLLVAQADSIDQRLCSNSAALWRPDPSGLHCRVKYRPVSNTAAALLPPWRHPGTAAPTPPCFMTVGQVVAVLSVAGRGLLLRGCGEKYVNEGFRSFFSRQINSFESPHHADLLQWYLPYRTLPANTLHLLSEK